MVSPLRPKGPRAAAASVRKALHVSNDPRKAGMSVMSVPDGLGYIVTVVEFSGALRVHMVRVDQYGDIFSLLADRGTK